jgi:hypothetical protein
MAKWIVEIALVERKWRRIILLQTRPAWSIFTQRLDMTGIGLCHHCELVPTLVKLMFGFCGSFSYSNSCLSSAGAARSSSLNHLLRSWLVIPLSNRIRKSKP